MGNFERRPDLAKLSVSVCEGNKKRGFSGGIGMFKTFMALIGTEISEAIEADRKNRRADFESYRQICSQYYGQFDKDAFEVHIKDTLEDEIADVVIRILDAYPRGEFNFDDLGNAASVSLGADYFNEEQSICDQLFDAVYVLTMRELPKSLILSCLLSFMEKFCDCHDIDLWFHVGIKLEYNATRNHKHGKEY